MGLLAVGAAGLVTIVLTLAAALAALGGASMDAGGLASEGAGASALARTEIPPLYLRLYEAASARYGLDWAMLAGIGKVECDHGRDPAPSCTHEGAVNSAGAGGPMQFLASTWARYGVAADGSGPPDRWDPADAIYAAANYLRASGAPSNYRQAIYAYNHAQWYVREVESWAARYRAPPGASAPSSSAGEVAGEGAEGIEGADVALAGETVTPVRFIPGQRAELAPGDGHVALVPTGVPATVQAMVVAGNELQDLPYGPSGHPDPLGATEEDCSSTVNYVLYRSGVRPLAEVVRENPLAQDYVGWGAPGPGRWVTIYATDSPTPHVFILIAGLRLDTSHNGTDVGPNRYEDGPRWRILDQIPTWAHWSVRHPPGL
ncbi:MAG TPA: lytic transglycosylase domain-containing protein [Solirubrobacteraceae bacterium]|nr:lytic transglycosylase domain-containing protein [Solirubrobacteraceae bacterium]